MIRNLLVVGLTDLTLCERLRMNSNLTLQRAIESARNSVRVKRQQGTIRSTVKNYEIEAVRRETIRLFKDTGCPWCRGYKAHERNRCPLNNSRWFNCGKPGHFKKTCRARVVKSIEAVSNIFNIASNNRRSNIYS